MAQDLKDNGLNIGDHIDENSCLDNRKIFLEDVDGTVSSAKNSYVVKAAGVLALISDQPQDSGQLATEITDDYDSRFPPYREESEGL